MKQTIYLDVLICVNLFINYFLLLAVAKFLKIYFKRKRIIAAAVLGAFYSLYILLPKINIIVSFLIKVIISVTIIICAFGFHSIKQFLKQFLCFYSINFAFCGTMFAIWYFIAPRNLIVKNGITYFNISPLLLVTTTLISYTVTRIIQKVTGQEVPDDLFCDIVIEQSGNTQKVRAKIDTGNSLKEPFSQLPVLIVEKRTVEKVVPKKYKPNKFRIVPY
ncbi:MAG: sigma-E processing peptidase SpoIIGA, partial [Helicobacter japonicus]|nr:sigma-E processing peptidase SpoIIGA [Helicobacter japonicus]